MKPQANGHSKESLFGAATRLWRVRKSGVAMVTTIGEIVTERLIDNRRDELADSDFFLDAADLGKGAGRLMGHWLATVSPHKTADAHFVYVNKLLTKFDDHAHAPMDLIMARYLASKIMLDVEGFTSETPGEKAYYEVFQNEARALLRAAIPGWEKASRRDVFLAEPFEGEALFSVIRRFLDLLPASDKQAMFQSWLSTYRNPLGDPADYSIELITLTYGREDEKGLAEELEEWFERYRQCKLKELDKQQNFMRTGIAAATGQLHWHAGGELWNKIFGRKSKKEREMRHAEPSVHTVKALIASDTAEERHNGNGTEKKSRSKKPE